MRSRRSAIGPDLARLHALVSGRVQAVGFRFSTCAEAERLGLAGWVRNLASGGVEIVAEGDEDALKQLAAWLHEGPPAASVERVEEDWAEYRSEFRRFEIR